VAWVVRQLGPAQTIEREQAHFVWSDHDPASACYRQGRNFRMANFNSSVRPSDIMKKDH
jgi:hypothetical protein